ncbi:Zinc resistance conferring protein [Collariella sp. IMI 366227]|nr:Zinc resistance conferring protein [Collariella sp. IMI 366227]
MGWSKSTRIKVMLAIDLMFFLLELGVGFAVHSLALMADAFHMWLRAEILGAFFNAVFLIALCVSIVLEAVTRLIEPPEIHNAQLILIVGCLGLASNLVGFVVLGGHGHSHGPGDHGHGEHAHNHGDSHSHAHGSDRAAEEGRIEPYTDAENVVADENGRVADLLPEAAIARYRSSFSEGMPRRSTDQENRRRTPATGRHGRLSNMGDISIHPASFRQEIIAASRSRPDDESASDTNTEDSTAAIDETDLLEDTPLLSGNDGPQMGTRGSQSKRTRRGSEVHHAHNHNKPKKPGKSHGHSHGDMGMNAMVLHVLGDALGNVGVIATALIIWLTDWPGRFYADPAVSLFITLIILRSALPLTVAASKILLQATPEHIDLNDVREDIQALPGVISCHHVHIWQLSDTKVVASMHIQVAFPISEAGGEKYMELSKMARKCLHAYGIHSATILHSATIQPEFCLDTGHAHAEQAADASAGLDGSSGSVAAGSAPTQPVARRWMLHPKCVEA